MVTYTVDQAQRDIAGLRGQIAHLMARAELLEVLIDTSLTLPDGTVWDSSGITGPLLLVDNAGPAAVAGAGSLYADASGFLRYLPDSSGSDSNIYGLSKVILSSADVVVGTGSPAITGLSANLAVGVYQIHAALLVQSTSTATFAAGWTGTATASSFKSLTAYQGGGQSTVQSQGTFGTLPGASTALVNSTAYVMRMDGAIAVSAAGTLTVTCHASAATAATVVTKSYMTITPT